VAGTGGKRAKETRPEKPAQQSGQPKGDGPRAVAPRIRIPAGIVNAIAVIDKPRKWKGMIP